MARTSAAVRAVIKGISGRRRTEDARAGEEKLRSILDRLLEGFQCIGFDWRYMYVNEAVARHGRRTKEELLGRTMMEMYPGIEGTEMFAYLKRCMEERIPHCMENEFTYPDGTKAWFELRIEPAPGGISILSLDITERRQAEEALRESGERYRNLVETARDVIYTLSTDGAITSLNRAFETTTGWSRAEWLGKPFASLPHPDDLPRAVQNYQRALRGEVPPVLEVRIRCRSGEYLTAEIAARPLLQDGEVVGTLGIARDITERKRAEEALRDSEERYRRLSEAAFEGIVVTDSGRIVDANKQLAKMFGYDLAEVIGMQALDFTAPESRDLVSQRIKSQYEKPYEHLALRKDGSIFPVEVRGKSIPHRGRSVRVTAIRDISERKRAEEALRDSEQRFRLLVETVNAIPWEVDLDTWRFTYVGPQAVKLLGYPLEDWYGEAFWADHVHPEDREQAARFCQETTARSEDHEFEYRMLAADGRTVWLGDIVSVVLGEGGPKMLRGIMVDISERKRAEEALREAREELEGKVERQLLRRNPYGLTFRELAVLHLVAAGRSDREIGGTLVISHLTAQKHISNILAKMGAASRTEASVRAVREGLLD